MSKRIISFESIKRQSDDFFNDLTAAVKLFRDNADLTTKGVEKSHIMQVIKQYTNINILMYIDPGTIAQVYTPYISAEHVFRHSPTLNSVSTIIDVTKNKLTGTVDVVNARVGGSFADIKVEMLIGYDLLKPGLLTDDELAAIMIHEVGHVFTCWQFMTTIAYGGLVISQTINNIFLEDNYENKTIHIKAAEEMLGVGYTKDCSEWVNTDKENVEIIMNSRFMRGIQDRSLSGYYDVRNCEQLADTFAAKHGAGVSLARANTKLQRLYGMHGHPNFFVHMVSQTLTLLTSITPFMGRSLSKIMLTLNQPKKYDDPLDRVMFIKFQLIDDLKSVPSGNKKLRNDIVNSIDEIDSLLKDIKVRKHVYVLIHETFTSAGRSSSKTESRIKELEKLLYNNLFLQSAKLKNLN